MRRPVIGVMGGGDAHDEVAALAEQLGTLIAQRDWILLTGGRNVGVMDAASRGADQAGGTVIGILPDNHDAEASRHLTVAIVTGMGHARNVINVLSSDVVIICPGGPGTLSEMALALKCGRPVIVLRPPSHDAELKLPGIVPPLEATTAVAAVDLAARILREQGCV